MVKVIRLAALLLITSMPVHSQAPVSSAQQGSSLEQRLDRIERMVDSQGLVDILQQLQQLQREISMLRGDIETQNYNLDQLTRRQRDLYTDVDQRLQRLERGAGFATDTVLDMAETEPVDGGPPLETLAPMPSYIDSPSGISSGSPLQIEIVGSSLPDRPATGSAVSNAPAEPTATLSEDINTGNITPIETVISPVTSTQTAPADPVQLQAEYQQAFNLLRQSLYDQAIRAFEQFMVRHPNDLYSDNAQYWLAEAYYVKREFPQALVEYNKVVSNFPQSQKLNDALLKIGFTLHELGEIDAARKQLQELIQKQPDSTVARLADERLKRISAMPQAGSPMQGSPIPVNP
jgi:tol-pal system protein YbgF